ncbi:unnamed protein product [Arabidopsis thaliana]|uniref:Uncharacterized protein n=1 Tax=Arabidopsis thaliana TaxID=3702 RepID=A0A5S9XC93_ARATH|nr:unnamed protein product [Arabidopsis thaliana]VYS57353.1 unnamed protein product [Arabidopsis thaliana]
MAGLKRKFNKGHAFTSKCVSLVKEQRARLYILRRCATMLCCCSIDVKLSVGVGGCLVAWLEPYPRRLELLILSLHLVQ